MECRLNMSCCISSGHQYSLKICAHIRRRMFLAQLFKLLHYCNYNSTMEADFDIKSSSVIS